MCIGGGSSGPDPSEVARQSEERRAQRIREGTESINAQFDQFGPEFFAGIEQKALDFFNPQLQDQFANTKEGMVKNLARSGNLSGSVGTRRLGELTEELGKQQAQVGDKARAVGLAAKGDVESNRAQLIQNLAASADPFAAAQAAAASAASISEPAEFSPIGDVFSKFAGLATPQIGAARQGFQNPASSFFGPQTSSSTIVR